jgi:DNA-directed RNA polymerase specialized sigma24 family protein
MSERVTDGVRVVGAFRNLYELDVTKKLSLFQWLHFIATNKLRDRERTIPTERPPLVGEVSANF